MCLWETVRNTGLTMMKLLTAKMTTIHIHLALAASQSWPPFKMDRRMPFLHGDLKEEVCICLCVSMFPPIIVLVVFAALFKD